MDSKTKNAVEAFNKFAQEYAEKYTDQSSYAKGLSIFAENLNVNQPSVLDVACGPGNVASFLIALNPSIQIKGIDLAPDMISIAQQCLPNGDFKVADCRSLDVFNQNYDGIVCSFILPYLNLADSTELLEKSHELLNNNGLLYLSTMEDDYSKSEYKPSSSGEGPSLFIHYYSKDVLTDLLQKIGFEMLYVSVQDFDGENPSADQDLIIVARKTKV